jgi:two-component system, cell cycle sensor histidine kinase and response regulator CckA
LSTQAEAVRAAIPIADSEAGRKQITVLLVEDEEFVREAAGHILESAGYRVLKARNAAEARREFGSCGGSVQVLLTDIVLPDTNGHDLARELGAVYPRIQTIFMSGYPENALNWQQTESAVGLYLAKPFSAKSLTAKMTEAERCVPVSTGVTAPAACSG